MHIQAISSSILNCIKILNQKITNHDISATTNYFFFDTCFVISFTLNYEIILKEK